MPKFFLLESSLIYIYIIGAGLLISISGCGTGNSEGPIEDTEPPVMEPIDIIISDVTENSLILSWEKATDNVSSQNSLSYKVAQSNTQTDVNTVANIIDNPSLVIQQGYDIGTILVANLDSSSEYYFNVVVEDEAGNKSVYAFTQAVTLTAEIEHPIVNDLPYDPSKCTTQEQKEIKDLVHPHYSPSYSKPEFKSRLDKAECLARTTLLWEPIIGVPWHNTESGAAFIPKISFHTALDIRPNDDGTMLYISSAFGGYATAVTNSGMGGKISIERKVYDESGGFVGILNATYLHIVVTPEMVAAINGNYVHAGDSIATALEQATTGGPHLHYELAYYEPTDNFRPASFVDAENVYALPTLEPYVGGSWEEVSKGMMYLNPEGQKLSSYEPLQ